MNQDMKLGLMLEKKLIDLLKENISNWKRRFI